ncbi:hypothetical protein ACS0TY_028495 [Phlomoides rotata]
MNTVSRRTRSKWNEFYRNKCAEKKKRANGDCDKSGEKNIEYSYIGSYGAGEKIEYCVGRNVGGEKLDLEKKRWEVDVRDEEVVSVDDLEKMNDDGDYEAGECSRDDGVKLEENKNDEGYFSTNDYVNTAGGDKVISIDEKDLFSISRSSDRKRSGHKIIRIEEKKLFSERRCNKKEGNNDEETTFDAAKSNNIDHRVEKKGCEWLEKQSKKREDELIKILVDSINAQHAVSTVEKNSNNNNASTHILPTRFRFEDEVVPPPEEKSEWEQHIDSLFQDLEFGLRQSHTHSCEVENDEHRFAELNETPAARCGRGEHLSVLDEQIGIVCKYCYVIILDIKYVLPDFYTRAWSRRAWREPDGSPSYSTTDPILFPGPPDCRAPESSTRVKGTVWDLVPGIEKGMFPHQREGFEFIWRNVAGDIVIDNLKQLDAASSSRGCIISHAPGTGKTRLTIAFLQTFLKQYPDCCPVIIAPKGMLLNWESEFSKWNFNVPFHNLNNKDLSGNENEVAVNIWKGVGAGMSTDATRILKLYSWTKDGGVLGISYGLFVKLTGEKSKEGHLHAKMKEMLLKCPGLLVLDEGHTPRNDQTLIWKSLTKVSTKRRIILSGTPFQNNMLELFNTLTLVNPEFVRQIGCEDYFVRKRWMTKRWMTLTRSIDSSRDEGLRKLRAMLDPIVHVHKGTILDDHLPGLRHTIVFLHPTECQKAILEEASSKVKNVFRRIRLVSMVSVHPSLKAATETSKTDEVEQDVDAGVKMKFLLKLVWLADALGERVLIFSQFLDPLTFIMKQIECHLSWREGREVLYMDGQLDDKQRQDSISSFNNSKSEAKVLLASQRACSEGINLVGASRVVLLDTVWNPSMEKQAVSRAYRLGQKKIVHVYRLFTSGVEVRQFAQQIKKVKISEVIFSGGDGQPCRAKKSSSEDKLMEAMLDLQGFNAIFEKVIYQPEESHLIDIFGLEGQN